jgi:hypothetical protein
MELIRILGERVWYSVERLRFGNSVTSGTDNDGWSIGVCDQSCGLKRIHRDCGSVSWKSEGGLGRNCHRGAGYERWIHISCKECIAYINICRLNLPEDDLSSLPMSRRLRFLKIDWD